MIISLQLILYSSDKEHSCQKWKYYVYSCALPLLAVIYTCIIPGKFFDQILRILWMSLWLLSGNYVSLKNLHSQCVMFQNLTILTVCGVDWFQVYNFLLVIIIWWHVCYVTWKHVFKTASISLFRGSNNRLDEEGRARNNANRWDHDFFRIFYIRSPTSCISRTMMYMKSLFHIVLFANPGCSTHRTMTAVDTMSVECTTTTVPCFLLSGTSKDLIKLL